MAENSTAIAAPISAPVTAPAGNGANVNTQPNGNIQSVKPTANQPAGAPKTFEVKVDGQVVKMTEAELLQAASLGKAAFKRMEEAKTLSSQAKNFIERFRRDPMAALEDPSLGLSDQQRREAIEKYYQKKYIEQDKLSPEQRELQKAQAELEKYKKQEQEQQKIAEQQRNKQLESQYHDHFEKIIIEALDKSGLPKTQHTVGRMAFYMQQALKNKFEAPMEMIVEQVRKDYQEAFQALTQSAPAEVLVNFLGPDAAKKIQLYALQQHKAKQAQGFSKPEPESTKVQPRKKSESSSDWSAVSKYWTRDSK